MSLDNNLLVAIKPTCRVAGSREAPEFGCSTGGSLLLKSIEPSVGSGFVEHEHYGKATPIDNLVSGPGDFQKRMQVGGFSHYIIINFLYIFTKKTAKH